MARQMAIGEVAGQARMSTSRIRYYETRGPLSAPERARATISRTSGCASWPC